MSARALLIGGYDEPLKGVLITEAARRIAAFSPRSTFLLIRDHFEVAKNSEPNSIVEYLAGGCFCCSMKHDFELLLRERGGKVGVRYFIAEVPLTAELDVVRASVREILGDDTEVTIAFTIDSSTVEVVMETFPELMRRNLSSSDMLVMRKGQKENAEPLKAQGFDWRPVTRLEECGQRSSDGADFMLLAKKASHRWPF